MAESRGQQIESSSRHIAWLLVCAAALHLPSLFNPFIIDDYIYLDTVHDLTWSGIPDVLNTATMDQEASGVWWTPDGDLPFYRPLAIMTFATDFLVWGMNPLGYHLTNLLLHLFCTYLVWRVASLLTDAPAGALAAATIFALHPAHCEAVFWISGRFDLLVCACVLGSVMAYFRWQRPGGAVGWGALSLLLYTCGLGCKETAIILPAVLVFCELLRWRGSAATYQPAKLAFGVVSIAAISILYLAKRFAIFGGLGTLPPPYGVDIHAPGAFGQIIWNLAQYLLDFVFFVQVDAIYLGTFWENNPWLLTVIAVAALAVLFAGWRCAGTARSFRTGVVFAAMFTAPALLAMPGERNVYLAFVGVAIIGGSVFSSFLASAAGNAGKVWRCGRVFVAFCSVMVICEQVVMWRVANGGEQVYRDLLAAIPDPPQDARIFIVNQSPLNAVGFTQGVKLRYNRPDVVACALAVAPRLEGFSSDRVIRTGPSSLRVVRENGTFFQSFVERFLMFSAPQKMAESARRVGLELLSVPRLDIGETELEFSLPYDLDDERLFLFVWENAHVQTLADLIWFAEWPRLVPCPIEEAPTATANN